MENPQFLQPPPSMAGPSPNLHVLPPSLANLNMPPPNIGSQGAPLGPPPISAGYQPRFEHRASQFHSRPFFRPFQPFVPRGPIGPMTLEDFDGKRLRKSVMRKTVDYNSAIIEALETRVWQRDYRDRRALQPDVMYYPELLPPPSYPDNAINCVTTRFVKTATNKMRCPIFCMAWTPEGRRLVTGASSGEFTLWNGLTFNFETILQAHDSPVRTMVWSHNDNWMVTGDHAGYVKYWQSNMNNVKMFQAHKEALRGISFSPSDNKFVTCSDDGTLRIWDFLRCHEERVLRGHGADVKCVHWHPQKALIISGSKDNQQPVKLWDPKTGQSLATLHAHKSTVMDLKWNENGNWLITASRDHLLKLFDLRNLSQEVQTFRGHKKEASSVAWHPTHEGLFSSGGSDGSIMFWHVGADKEVGAIEQAHDSIVWTLAWHPLGHILCSGSNDHSSKFWTRNRPGDMMRDKYNLNTLPAGLAGLEDIDIDEPSVIPGMGPEDRVELNSVDSSNSTMAIPGLDLDVPPVNAEDKPKTKKVPYSKPIPRNFQAQWNDTGTAEEDEERARDSTISEVISHIVENTPGVVPLEKITPSAIIVYGKLLPVEPGSELEKVISEGPEALKRYIASGAIEELHDVMPHEEEDDYLNDEYIDDDGNIPTLSVTNIKLPSPLPSSKLAQEQKNQSHIPNAANQDRSQDNRGERPRRTRFSDITDNDKDMRPSTGLQSLVSGNFGQPNQDRDLRMGGGDVDFRQMNSMPQDEDLRMQDTDLRNFSGSDMRNYGNRDFDFRNRFDENHPSPKRPRFDSPSRNRNNNYDDEEGDFDEDEEDNENSRNWQPRNRSWNGPDDNNAGQKNFNSRFNLSNNFGPPSNNGPNSNKFYPNEDLSQDNYGMDSNSPGQFSGPNFGGMGPGNFRPPGPNFRPMFGGNFRPEGPAGPWGPGPRMDNFRGRGYGPRGPPMRGGPPRGHRRGGVTRGRNTFN